jgi:RNA polymerase sigma factor (sigma-70 family)
VVQSVFATAAKRWTTIDDPHPYLRQAVVNRANDSHRKAFRRRKATQPAEPAIPDEPVLDGVWDLIQTLPRAQRTVVVLRYYADLSLVEIADVVGRPASTVRSDLRRALINLKENLT